MRKCAFLFIHMSFMYSSSDLDYIGADIIHIRFSYPVRQVKAIEIHLEH